MKKIFAGVIVAVIVIGTKLAIKYGLGYGLAEADVNSSKNESWPADFKKEFIEACSNADETANKEFMHQYCICATDRIEAAHIIPTKYNSIKETMEDYDKRVGKLIEDFMASEPGQKIASECVEATQENFNGSDHGDNHDHN